jgi:hypothetical protein
MNSVCSISAYRTQKRLARLQTDPIKMRPLLLLPYRNSQIGCSETCRRLKNPSKLDALVLGHVVILKPKHPNRVVLLQQYCFVKDEQRDCFGHTNAIWIPVTRAMLKGAHPYTDILDVDPFPQEIFQRWASRAGWRSALKDT